MGSPAFGVAAETTEGLRGELVRQRGVLNELQHSMRQLSSRCVHQNMSASRMSCEGNHGVGNSVSSHRMNCDGQNGVGQRSDRAGRDGACATIEKAEDEVVSIQWATPVPSAPIEAGETGLNYAALAEDVAQIKEAVSKLVRAQAM